MESVFDNLKAPDRPSLFCRIRRQIARKTAVIGYTAGAPGMGIALGLFLIGDALVVGSACERFSGNASMVGSLTGVCMGPVCVLYARSTPLICTRDASGAWSVRIPAKDDDHRAIDDLQASGRPVLDTALITIQRPSTTGMGVWSPSISSRNGRWLRTQTLDPTLTAQDEAAAAKAVVAAWPALVAAGTVRFAEYPLEQAESDAISQGRRSQQYSLRWRWLANDAAVLGAITLLFLGHSRRAARRAERRAGRTKQYFENCVGCGYALQGLPKNTDGTRTCPECGRPAGGLS